MNSRIEYVYVIYECEYVLSILSQQLMNILMYCCVSKSLIPGSTFNIKLNYYSKYKTFGLSVLE